MTLSNSECNQYPTVVEIERLGYLFSMAVGLPESFVQITPDSNDQPYLIAAAPKDSDKDGTFNFYFQGLHHTEIPRRNILPISKARELARTFLITGIIPEDIDWEEV